MITEGENKGNFLTIGSNVVTFASNSSTAWGSTVMKCSYIFLQNIFEGLLLIAVSLTTIRSIFNGE